MKKIRTEKYDDAPLTSAELKRLRPARDVDPKLVAAYEAGKLRYRGQRGKQKSPVKSLISLRVDREVLDYFRSKGKGWQSLMNTALKAFADVGR